MVRFLVWAIIIMPLSARARDAFAMHVRRALTSDVWKALHSEIGAKLLTHPGEDSRSFSECTLILQRNLSDFDSATFLRGFDTRPLVLGFDNYRDFVSSCDHIPTRRVALYFAAPAGPRFETGFSDRLFNGACLARSGLACSTAATQWAVVSARPNFALPMFIEDSEPPILLAHLKRCVLHGLGEEEARAALTEFLKPAQRPLAPLRFPGASATASTRTV